MKGLTLALIGAGLLAWLAGCGTSSSSLSASAATSTRPVPSHTAAVKSGEERPGDPVDSVMRPRLVRVAPTAYGTALVDRRGFALYRFTRDTKSVSTCYRGCATSWPPYLVPSKLAGGLTNTRLAGTIRRTDGRLQVTYAGHPLYYYVGDRRPGQVLCQGVTEFGGGWYVVAPSGHIIR
jgi:predicted lipoprotein with Yx(FWY)xxD motif